MHKQGEIAISASGLALDFVRNCGVDDPNYQDRIERNYEVAVNPDRVAALWRQLSEFLPKYGLHPINQITGIGTVYFDNRDYDLTRYTILNPARRMLVRLRTYENYGESPRPISNYWIEIKTRLKGHWKKKRFRLSKVDLPGLLEGRDVTQSILDDIANGGDPEVIRNLYQEIQELILTMGLKPFFLLTYKRLAFQSDTERVSLDWEIQYYDVGTNIYSYDSWKYPVEAPAGKSQKTILELKYTRGTVPVWITDLEKNFPIQETGFLKFVEGMGALLRGPLLKTHKEAAHFLRLIEAYGGESGPLE